MYSKTYVRAEPFPLHPDSLGCSFTLTLNNGGPQVTWGALCLISADNLALGGMKVGSKAYRGCRQCLATPSEMKSVFVESKFRLRDSCSDSERCDDLEAAKRL